MGFMSEVAYVTYFFEGTFYIDFDTVFSPSEAVIQGDELIYILSIIRCYPRVLPRFAKRRSHHCSHGLMCHLSYLRYKSYTRIIKTSEAERTGVRTDIYSP